MDKNFFYHLYIYFTSGFSNMLLLTFFFPTENPWVYFATGVSFGVVFTSAYPSSQRT